MPTNRKEKNDYLCHFAIYDRFLARVDDDEWQRDSLALLVYFWAYAMFKRGPWSMLCVAWGATSWRCGWHALGTIWWRQTISSDKVLERDLLGHELLQMLRLLLYPFLPRPQIHLSSATLQGSVMIDLRRVHKCVHTRATRLPPPTHPNTSVRTTVEIREST